MKTEKHESEVTRLMSILLNGCKIDRVFAWKRLRIADVRSRISDCERYLGLKFNRERVPGKRYVRYYL